MLRNRGTNLTAVLVFVASGLLTTATAASAAPSAPEEPNATTPNSPCGYYQTEKDAYYNHCSNKTSVVINVDTIWASDYTKCVGPGVTYLGSTDDIRFASYVGRTC
ncbi:DUF6355 family natural product biosynthesis protein [Actinopolyspora halophila]|uniref:DUF6355 family natural product biosynthesis protein n=1 Tax=Actinopolyspora halophila TaxID=1850 RepID=UPI00036441D9|nr:DUF6355 family natural product biosynthesis protein [Actinopolyspora halophila]